MQPWCFSWEKDVEFGDLDTNDHVNNVILLRWLQEARVAYMRQKLAPKLAVHGEKLSLVVAESALEYRAPIFYPERVAVLLAVAAVGNSSFSFRYEVVKKKAASRGGDVDHDEGEPTLCGKGNVRMVCIDPQTQRKASITPALRRLLEADAALSTRNDGSTTAESAAKKPQPTPRPPASSAEGGGDGGDEDDEDWPICWVHEVEYRDLDVNVHANNIAVYYWMQEARVKWLDEVRRELAKITPDESFDAVVAAATVQYLSPMLYEEEARVYARMKQLGNSSMLLEHKIVRTPKEKRSVQTDGNKGGEVCYRGTAALVAFDHEKQTKAAITPALRLALERVQQRNRQQCRNGTCKL